MVRKTLFSTKMGDISEGKLENETLIITIEDNQTV